MGKYLLLLLLVPVFLSAQVAVFDTVTIYDIQYTADPLNNNGSSLEGDTVVVKIVASVGPRSISAGARWSFLASDPDGGAWSGVQIIQHDTASSTAQNTGIGFTLPGDMMWVTGVVEEFSGGTELAILIDPDHYPVLISENNPVPGPFVVPTGDLQDAANGEQWEGSYVMVENAFVINNSLPFRECSLDDGSGLVELSAWFLGFRDSLDNGWYTYPANGARVNASGFVRDAYANYTINPVYTNQVVNLTFPPVISDVSRTPIVPTSAQAVDVSAKVVDGNGTVSSVKLYYSVDYGTFTEVNMTSPDSVYSGTIPAQANDSFVRFFLKSEDNEGDISQAPGDTSESTYFYFVRDGGMSIKDVQFTPYANGNSGMVGQTVTLTGIVMTDTLESTAYYYIQDSNEPWHGIRIRDDEHGPNKGDEVTVTGVVEENSLITRIINVSSYNVNSTANPLWAPQPVQLDFIDNDGPLLEANESVFMKISGLTVTNPFPDDPGNYGEFTVDDGTGEVRVDDYFFMFDGNLDSTYVINTVIDSMYGFGYYSFNNSKFIPRGDYDLFGVNTSIEKIDQVIPSQFTLEQNYPNPFNPNTKINFSVARTERVRLTVYNILGQKVADLLDLRLQPGNYEVNWNGMNELNQQVASGVYIYRMVSESTDLIRKMTLIR